MKQFAELFMNLDRTNKTNAKVELMKNYFLTASDEDKLWALTLFTGRRPSFKVNRTQVKEWAAEEAGIPMWLFQESYHSVGDLGETISLLLPRSPIQGSDKSLTEWFHYLNMLPGMTDIEKHDHIIQAWMQLSQHETFVFNKLLMGSFRIGVSQTLVVRALAEATETDSNIIAHRVMGQWDPLKTTFETLILDKGEDDNASRPYPFFLAYPVEGDVSGLGNPEDWFAEWKWDGIRSQIIFRNGELFIWTRGEELSTEKFPELHFLSSVLPEGTVLDGEIVSYTDNRPMPFSVLQTRIGRKNLSKKALQEAPVAFIAYDILEIDRKDIRSLTQQERRTQLELLHQSMPAQPFFLLSPLIGFKEWNELHDLHPLSRQNAAEGFMIKRKNSTYQVGRKKGDWWKWKINPLSVDAVLIYAQKGSGRRAELFTDYTFAVWGDDGKLIPFAKAYSGLTDVEIGQVDYFIKRNVLEKFGPVRTVKPELVFEIGFEGINESSRHKSGIAVRFPRILRWRKDKKAEEADTLENLKGILETYR
ncbi:ATP-dependent DNA ligase [Dyadobacter sediminis]|uniref:DNA ligase (ATP) n=1 Tax=Dyadobacter sediminis TaxID=1493691 RepID=A0A5R9K5M0_9BACT|nr:ATP-dependent DNA ligase [Dyadobacter sediminis]TLU88852.1 ATP-dependent DNA ligase [Dyadobacter sediminis]GGC13719.1 ATP-dependent DNA ligase [Dyadobacter sediminis]